VITHGHVRLESVACYQFGRTGTGSGLDRDMFISCQPVQVFYYLVILYYLSLIKLDMVFTKEVRPYSHLGYKSL